MPEFTYIARDATGHTHSGVMDAESTSQLAAQLRGRGWVVLAVDAAGRVSALASLARMVRPYHWLPATRLDVELAMQQIATMLRSGLTLLNSLRTAADQARRGAMARVLRRVAERIEEGSSFADALAADGRLFPMMVVQLVRVGEESGTLDLVLRRAAMHLKTSRQLKTTLLTSLMYPTFVLFAAIGVTAFMVFSLIPKIQKFLIGRGRRLPEMSQMLIDFTNWANAHATAILLTALAALVGLVVLIRWPRARQHVDKAVLRVPVIGRLLRLAGTATVARALSLLLESGITLLMGLQTVRGLLGNRAMQTRLDDARESVMAGGALGEGFLQGKEFTPMLGKMTSVGESTGTLDTVLEELAEFHEEQLAGAVRRFSALIEPVMILVVGGIVGFVYIAFFMALFSVASGGAK